MDPNKVRDHLETILESYEQVFENFFLSKFIGLNFQYLPVDVADTAKDRLRITFEVNEMLMNPQALCTVELWRQLWISRWDIF